MRVIAQTSSNAPVAIAWEECVCLLCGGARLSPCLESSETQTGLRFLIVKCNRCGLAFTNPRPDVDSMTAFYTADYHAHRVKEYSSRTDTLERWLPPTGLARLLDFGCGSGDFLVRMQARGWNVVGLEASENAVRRCRARGLSVHWGSLPHPLWSEPCFEAITMRQSLEHTHDPLEVLRAAHRLLRTGGKLLVSVPNFDSCAARWFGANWFGLDVPRHLTHFTPRTLQNMLYRAGFEGVQLRHHRRPSWIRHSAELAQRAGDARKAVHVLQSRWASGLSAWWGRLIGRADCLFAIAIKS